MNKQTWSKTVNFNLLPEWFEIREPVKTALAEGRPVVALESTLIAHGLPYPMNLQTAYQAEAIVQDHNCVPATIAVLAGKAVIGIDKAAIDQIATSTGIEKASRRDLPGIIYQKKSAAVTVAASIYLANLAGISVFATGGIGGVHRELPGQMSRDISADLTELARTPIITVCSGAKNILDLHSTLELLETLSVPVVGFRCDYFPAFYVQQSEWKLPLRLNESYQIAELYRFHFSINSGSLLLVQSAPNAVSQEEFQKWLQPVEQQANRLGVHGPDRTPFLLRGLAHESAGKTLEINQKLIVQNAKLAAQIGRDLYSSTKS